MGNLLLPLFYWKQSEKWTSDYILPQKSGLFSIYPFLITVFPTIFLRFSLDVNTLGHYSDYVSGLLDIQVVIDLTPLWAGR